MDPRVFSPSARRPVREQEPFIRKSRAIAVGIALSVSLITGNALTAAPTPTALPGSQASQPTVGSGGVPVVTVPGDTFAGRHSFSHLSNVGLQEFVGEDYEVYVEIAASLAGAGIAAITLYDVNEASAKALGGRLKEHHSRIEVETGSNDPQGYDLVVNATRTKQLTNFRVSGKEDAIKVTPPIDLSLEYGVEFIEDDELVEITPKSIRLRKRHLKEHERKRASREAA